MEPIVQLVKFFFAECSVKWSGDNTPLHEIDHRYSMDYHVWANDKNERIFKLQLILRIEPPAEGATGYTIECRLSGLFAFPESTEPARIPMILRMNGSAILYGILRGQIASLTGVFEAGSLQLPTINMKDAVEQIEKRKLENASMAQPVKSIKEHGATETKPRPKRAPRTKSRKNP